MAINEFFAGSEHEGVLRKAFQDEAQAQEISEIVELFVNNSIDKAQMHNDLLEYAKRHAEPKGESLFVTLEDAVSSFIAEGKLGEEEGQLILKLKEEGHRKLNSIWKVY